MTSKAVEDKILSSQSKAIVSWRVEANLGASQTVVEFGRIAQRFKSLPRYSKRDFRVVVAEDRHKCRWHPADGGTSGTITRVQC